MGMKEEARDWLLLIVFIVAIAWAISLRGQEAAKSVEPASHSSPVYVEEVEAAGGKMLFRTLVDGPGWFACKNMREYGPLSMLRRADPEQFDEKLDFEVERQRCVRVNDRDLVLVGPADRPGVLSISFRARKDVHPTLAWFIACDALPQVAGFFCHE